MPDPGSLTAQQKKWFASVREGLERDTGRSLEEWARIARTCPETAPRKRQAWMKQMHGLGQNRAAMVLNAAFSPDTGWSTPDALAERLWVDPAARAIHDAVRDTVLRLPDVLVGQRRGFTAYSRKRQFCAARPARRSVLLGLAIDPREDASLSPRGREAWSERLTGQILLETKDGVTGRIADLIRAAWERS
jgi:hypothetical protein